MAKNERSRRRRQEKKRQREKRIARARNLRRNEPQFEPYEPGNDAPFASERHERRVRLLVGKLQPQSEDELRRCVEELAERPWFELAVNEVEANPIELAQELAFCALETGDAEEALDLAEEALELDPSNCDALFAVATLLRHEMSDDDWLKSLYDAVEAGSEGLGGDSFLRSTNGRLGAFVTARPYLRARIHLALELLRRERDDEALVELEDLVRLDQDDVLAARELLLGLALLRGELEKARGLLASSPPLAEDVTAWARVLERRSSGDERGAFEALARACALTADLVPRLESSPSPAAGEAGGDDASALIDTLLLARPEHADLRRWMLDAVRAG